MTTLIATLDVQTIAQTAYSAPTDATGNAIFAPDDENFLFNLLDGERYEPTAVHDGQALAEFAGRACYQAFERKRPETATNKGYLANIQKQSHWSVLEHASASLYIQGVSRALTHELVRHRHMSYSQLSQRYVDSGDVKFVIPPMIEQMARELVLEAREAAGEPVGLRHDAAVDRDVYEALEYFARKQFARTLADYRDIEDGLRECFPGAGTKEVREAARFLLPNATETKIVVTGNYRSWAEFLIKRDSLAADAEFQRLAKEIGRQLAVIAPNVFGAEARALWDHAFVEQRASSI